MRAATDWRAWLRSCLSLVLALDPGVKAALVIAVALLASVAIYSYFSPYQSCVRALKSVGNEDVQAHWKCARVVGRGK